MFFGLSLFGVPSINLDKMKGHQVLRKLQILFMFYALSVILSCMLPTRVETVDYGEATLIALDANSNAFLVTKNQSGIDNPILRFRQPF